MSGLPWSAAVEPSAGLGVWEQPPVFTLFLCEKVLEGWGVQLWLTSESLQSCGSACLRAGPVDMRCACAVGISIAVLGETQFSGYTFISRDIRLHIIEV